MEQVAKSLCPLSLSPECGVCSWDKGWPAVGLGMAGKLCCPAHVPCQGQRGTARARDRSTCPTHMVRCLAGLRKPVQSNPRNTPCLKSNSCLGECGWGLQGWCKVPSTGRRGSLARRVLVCVLGIGTQHLFATGSRQPCRGVTPASSGKDTVCCLCKGPYSFRAVIKAGHRARSRVSFNFFFSEHHM